MTAGPVVPLKRFVDPVRPITYGIVQAGPDTDNGVPYVRPIDMTDHSGVRDLALLRTTSHTIADQYRRSEIRKGDVVVTIGPSYGKVMVVPSELEGANLTQGTARIAPASHSLGRYIYWSLQTRSARAYWKTSVGGATFAALNLAPLAETPVVFHSLSTQCKIAVFLDRETERIDALIDKKRRLIDLLEEKRTATITQAVTKGLNPTAPMKDSSIPWIGEIPAHWEVRKVAHVFRLGSGTTPRSDDTSYYGGAIPWVLTGDLPDGPIRRTEKKITERSLADYSVLKTYPTKSLVMAMYGATIGKLGWMTQPSTVNQACCVLQPLGALHPEFAFYWLFANRPHIVAMGVGSGQPNISQEIISQLRVPAPGLMEQQQVVEHLNVVSSATDTVTSRITTQLTLLAEYREALITAAVTGEIDIQDCPEAV